MIHRGLELQPTTSYTDELQIESHCLIELYCTTNHSRKPIRTRAKITAVVPAWQSLRSTYSPVNLIDSLVALCEREKYQITTTIMRKWSCICEGVTKKKNFAMVNAKFYCTIIGPDTLQQQSQQAYSTL